MTPGAGQGTADALQAVARLGPYFAVSAGASARDEHPARPMGELYDTADRSALLGLVEHLAHHLRTTEVRVAASILFQEVAARLWSVLLAVGAGTGRVPDLSARSLCWRPRPTGGISLALPHPTGWCTPHRDLAALPELVWDLAVPGHLRPLHDAVRAVTPISTRVLWGNAASALVGVTQALESHPGLAAPTRRLAGRLLRREPLRAAGTSTVQCVGGRTTMSYARRNCCLYYLLPAAGTCGDCVLRERPARLIPAAPRQDGGQAGAATEGTG